MWILELECVPELSKSSASNEPLQTDIWLTTCVRSHVDSSPRVALWQLQRSHHLPTPMASSVRIIIYIHQHISMVFENCIQSFNQSSCSWYSEIAFKSASKICIQISCCANQSSCSWYSKNCIQISFRVSCCANQSSCSWYQKCYSFKVLIRAHAVGIRKCHLNQLLCKSELMQLVFEHCIQISFRVSCYANQSSCSWYSKIAFIQSFNQSSCSWYPKTLHSNQLQSKLLCKLRKLHSFKVLIRAHAVGIRKLHSNQLQSKLLCKSEQSNISEQIRAE